MKFFLTAIGFVIAILALAFIGSQMSMAQPIQNQVSPSQIAIAIDDNANALAKFAEQQAKAVDMLNSRVVALTKERDDLKKKVDDLTKGASATPVPAPAAKE